MKSICLDCVRLLRRMQQINRFVTNDRDTKLSITQTFLLLEIENNPLLQRELQNKFQLSQSSISRHFRELERFGLIKRVKKTNDRRALSIELTAKGRTFVRRYHLDNNREIKKAFRPLSQTDQRKFLDLFKLLNDYLGVPRVKLNRFDSPLRAEMRRIVFAFSPFGDSFMSSGLPIASWQILSELQIAEGSLTQLQISKRCGIPQTTLPVIMARLSRSGLITTTKNPDDSRSKLNSITKKGAKYVLLVESRMIDRIGVGVKSLGTKNSRLFVELLSRLIGETSYGAILLSNSLTAQDCPKSYLPELRRMIVSRFLNNKRDIPHILLEPNAKIFLLRNNGSPTYALEFSEKTNLLDVKSYKISEHSLKKHQLNDAIDKLRKRLSQS